MYLRNMLRSVEVVDLHHAKNIWTFPRAINFVFLKQNRFLVELQD